MDTFANIALEKQINIPEIEKIIFIEPSNFIRNYSAYCFFRIEGSLFSVVCGLGETLSCNEDIKLARETILKSYKDEHSFVYRCLLDEFFDRSELDNIVHRIHNFSYMTTRCLMVLSNLDSDIEEEYYDFALKDMKNAMLDLANKDVSYLDIYNLFTPEVSKNDYKINDSDFVRIFNLSK